jgi:predicted transporter
VIDPLAGSRTGESPFLDHAMPCPFLLLAIAFSLALVVLWINDENGTEISRTDGFCFLYYDYIFKYKKLSVLMGFTTIFNHFLYSLIAKM